MDAKYIEVQHKHNIKGESDAFNIRVRERAKVLIESLKSAITLGKISSILDAGCREGMALDIFKLYAPKVRAVGIDIVPEFVESARKKHAEVYQEDVHDLSRFKDDEFDWVFTSHTLEHCYDPSKAFSELSRVAAKGMLIFVPLEGDESFSGNPSHFYHTKDPMDWLIMFRRPKWILDMAYLTDYSDLMCALVHPSTIQYGGRNEP